MIVLRRGCHKEKPMIDLYGRVERVNPNQSI